MNSERRGATGDRGQWEGGGGERRRRRIGGGGGGRKEKEREKKKGYKSREFLSRSVKTNRFIAGEPRTVNQPGKIREHWTRGRQTSRKTLTTRMVLF